MKRITLDVNDDFIEEFIDRLDEFAKENNLNSRELTIFGLSLAEYRKTCLNDFKKEKEENNEL